MRKWRPRGATEAAAADRAVRFFAGLKHVHQPWAGKPFELLPWQREVIGPLFGTLDPEGLRVFREVYIEVGKKNGKSSLAAGLALKMLFADDEALPEVYGAAVDKEQAGIVFRVAEQMVRTNSYLSGRCRIITSAKRIIVTKGASAGGFYQALPADAAGADGVDPSALVFDEIHRYPNRELYDVLVRSTAARRQPVIFGITTSGYDRESLCWSLHEHARQVLEGTVSDPSLLAMIHAAKPELDFRDRRAWKQANPSFGITVPASYYEREAQKAADDPTKENSFRRFHLNQWVRQETRWMPMAKWDATAGEVSVTRLRGRLCYAGLDLANTSDLAALALIFPPTEDKDFGIYRVIAHFWLPEEDLEDRVRRDRVPYDRWARDGWVTLTPGNTIDYDTIRQDLQRIGMRYLIPELAADPTNSWQMMQELAKLGYQVLPVRQAFATLGPPTKELMRLVLQGKLHHGGNPVLRWMVDSTTVEQDSNGTWKPSKKKSTQKIDGVIAMVLGLDRALRHAEDDGDDDGYLVYDDRVRIGPSI